MRICTLAIGGNMRDLPDLTHLAAPGTEIAVRVTPKASRNEIVVTTRINVRVTAAPEGGKANALVQKLLAKALGVAKSRVDLVRGATAREKVFRIL